MSGGAAPGLMIRMIVIVIILGMKIIITIIILEITASMLVK